jgi:DNA-directed RNA polymerase specialized sigma24 family protein/ribosome-associated translation inhibitor RaiA
MGGIVIRGLSGSHVQEAEAHWARCWRWIETLLGPFPPDQRTVRVTVEAEPTRCEAHAVLMLPTATLTAKGRGSDVVAALDEAADRLVDAINAHKATLRREFLHHRRHRRRSDLSGILPILEERHAIGDRENFVDLLGPALRELSDHARRELIIAQLEGIVAPGDLSVADLLSQVVSRAWRDFEKRPQVLRLELWLTRLVFETLDQRGPEPAKGTRSERIAVGDTRATAQSGWTPGTESFWPPAETLTLASVVPVPARGSAWELASDEEQRVWILSHLRKFTREQRRAFVLYVLEGWNDDEVAAIQGGSPEEVLLNVERVREELGRMLADEDRNWES